MKLEIYKCDRCGMKTKDVVLLETHDIITEEDKLLAVFCRVCNALICKKIREYKEKV